MIAEEPKMTFVRKGGSRLQYGKSKPVSWETISFRLEFNSWFPEKTLLVAMVMRQVQNQQNLFILHVKVAFFVSFFASLVFSRGWY